MANLISASLKTSVLSAIDNIHDSFARDITIINEVSNVSITEPNDEYNAFSDKKHPNITYSATETIITARIKYMDKAESESQLIFHGGAGGVGGSAPLNQNYGIIRIKVKTEYTDLVKNSTKIIVDGYDCQLDSNYTTISMVDINYAVFYLTRQK